MTTPDKLKLITEWADKRPTDLEGSIEWAKNTYSNSLYALLASITIETQNLGSQPFHKPMEGFDDELFTAIAEYYQLKALLAVKP